MSGKRPNIEDDRVARVLDHWLSVRAGAIVPMRDAIDPDALTQCLPHTWIYKFDAEVGDFVCVIAGEEIDSAWGIPIENKRLLDIVGPEDHEIVLDRWHQLLAIPAIMHGSTQKRLAPQKSRNTERLILPLAASDGTISYMLGASIYQLQPPSSDGPEILRSNHIDIVPCADL
ncbi:MAG: PAS domain-containing protein [Rhodospirillaceae bacterium]|jgi:hypothetical protein|nr:PAS domain-containing protein [Rhodospirillaceae bacterium]MBT6138635.1 PAS domain-containing protein [Rhodospirillaceae bacterium]